MSRVAVNVAVKHRTDLVALCELAGGREVWVPLSLLEDDPPQIGERGPVSLPGWYAEREGIEEDDGVDLDPDADRGPGVILRQCSPRPRKRGPRVSHPTLGQGEVLADKSDRVVVLFSNGQERTILRDRLTFL